MIEPIKYFIKGEVGTQSIEEIKGLGIEVLSNRLSSLATNDEDGLFPEKFIHINKKNIEFGESFHITDYIMTSEMNKAIKGLGYSDVLFIITIFRLGSYSYYAISGKLLREGEPEQIS